MPATAYTSTAILTGAPGPAPVTTILSPVRATKQDRQALGAERFVLSPVRRSGRKPAGDGTLRQSNNEVHELLEKTGWCSKYPVFSAPGLPDLLARKCYILCEPLFWTQDVLISLLRSLVGDGTLRQMNNEVRELLKGRFGFQTSFCSCPWIAWS